LSSSVTARILPLALTKKKAEEAVAPAASLSGTTDVTDELKMKRDESLSPSLFTFVRILPPFTTISITHYDGAKAGIIKRSQSADT
jgi:hypothetical protein